MLADLHDTALGRLRHVGQRFTRSRQALIDTLAAAGRPLSIPDILATDTGAPQSSVYRNLAVLEQAGVVRKVHSVDEFSRFELAEDLTQHHHHLVCVSCGTVADYTAPAQFERSMVMAMDEVSAATGFRPESHRLDLVGVCARCA